MLKLKRKNDLIVLESDTHTNTDTHKRTHTSLYFTHLKISLKSELFELFVQIIKTEK